MCCIFVDVFFFKQKTAYEMRISDWSSDVCSSDLRDPQCLAIGDRCRCDEVPDRFDRDSDREDRQHQRAGETREIADLAGAEGEARICRMPACEAIGERSEEHTSELQSLMRSSYAVFCLKKTNQALVTNQHLIKSYMQNT